LITIKAPPASRPYAGTGFTGQARTMALLLWQDDLNTGIEVIDDQHRRIVHMINQLHQAQTG